MMGSVQYIGSLNLNSTSFRCTKCNQSFKFERTLHQHEIKEHGMICKRNVPCGICGRSFTHQFCLEDHMKNPGRWHLNHAAWYIRRRPSPTLNTGDDFTQNRDLDLNKYIAEYLQPDKAFHEKSNSAINALYRKLQEGSKHSKHLSIRIHNLIKGGSIAKGTALKGSSDLDCVLVLNNVTGAAMLKEELPGIIDELEIYLKENSTFHDSWKLLEINKRTAYSLQFTMNHPSFGEIDVDLLPTFNADVTTKKARATLYKQMLSGDERFLPYYSAALVKLQRDFVKEEPAKVKDLIRLVKHWRMVFLPSKSGKHGPVSYFLELLTIDAWGDAGRPLAFDMKIGFKAVLKMLQHHCDLDVAWKEYYDENIVQPPRVIDPANPANDLYKDIDTWSDVSRMARETMNSPLLQSVTITENWKSVTNRPIPSSHYLITKQWPVVFPIEFKMNSNFNFK